LDPVKRFQLCRNVKEKGVFVKDIFKEHPGKKAGARDSFGGRMGVP